MSELKRFSMTILSRYPDTVDQCWIEPEESPTGKWVKFEDVQLDGDDAQSLVARQWRTIWKLRDELKKSKDELQECKDKILYEEHG